MFKISFLCIIILESICVFNHQNLSFLDKFKIFEKLKQLEDLELFQRKKKTRVELEIRSPK